MVKAGRRDLVPLTQKGAAQAAMLADSPVLKNAEIIISSPYTRALQTAALLNRALGLPLEVEYNLHEWVPDQHWAFDSMTQLQEIIEDFQSCNGIQHPDQPKCWEETDQLKKRVMDVLQKYTGFKTVIVVCHEMVIKSIVPVETVQHCEILEYSFQGDLKSEILS